MTDQQLSDLLERYADRHPVGAPPLADMVAGADRLRRRRTTTRVALASAAVVAVVGGAALVTLPGGDPSRDHEVVPADTDPTGSTDPTPPGTRLVGIGHSAIAVPEDWATNALRCGTAERPTVVVDVSVVEACLWLAPQAYDAVWIERGVNEAMFTPAEEIEVDGVPAQRDETTCAAAGDEVQHCTGTVYVPSEDASYRAIAATEERVEEILSWIRVVPDLVAVPGYETANLDHQDDDAGEHYRAELLAAGLEVAVRTEARPRGFKPGYVLDVTPRPGTMLAPGDTVTMTVVSP